MKIINLLFVIVLFFLPYYTFSQNKLVPGNYKMARRVLSVRTSPKDAGRIYIEDENNSTASSNNDLKNLTRIGGVKFRGENTLNSIFLTSLNKTKLQELAKDNYNIFVNLYINNMGRVENVQFYTTDKTKISLGEFDALTDSIKNNIIIDVPDDFDKSKRLAPISQVIHFKKLI
ncbi:hypothetical protein SAMN05216436_1463 [bacterium A37T11]|nr:hypothetical protein SAMN05216436_1463 [bacterium A37T11]